MNQTLLIGIRLYKSPAEVILGFDLPCCSICYDGKDVYLTDAGMYAINNKVNIFDMHRMSPSYIFRLIKYFSRGYKIILPSFDIKKVNKEKLEKAISVKCPEFPDDENSTFRDNMICSFTTNDTMKVKGKEKPEKSIKYTKKKTKYTKEEKEEWVKMKKEIKSYSPQKALYIWHLYGIYFQLKLIKSWEWIVIMLQAKA